VYNPFLEAGDERGSTDEEALALVQSAGANRSEDADFNPFLADATETADEGSGPEES
jgi:hypothetical protein